MHDVDRQLRLGTRSSPMAMQQAGFAAQLLAERHPGLDVTVVPMVASGDRYAGNLADIGGKGAWVRELDLALMSGAVAATISCAKDLPSPHDRPAGTAIGAVLARSDARDALVVASGSPHRRLADLPAGSRIGTSAPRRIAQLRRLRPDLSVAPIRGNANSRLAKLDSTDGYDALILAVTGLERIKQYERVTEILSADVMCPASGAGILVIEHRAGDIATADLLAPLTDSAALAALTAERGVLSALYGNCQSAVAAHAEIRDNSEVSLHAVVWDPVGAESIEAAASGPAASAERIGAGVAADLISRGALAMLGSRTHGATPENQGLDL